MIALAVFSAGSYFYVDRILTWLAKPIGEFIFTSPAEAFFIHIKVAVGMGCILSFPVWVHQLWKFVGQGLEGRERSAILNVLPFALGLFFVGAAAALFLVAPAAVKFLMSYQSPTLRPMISLSEYLSFIFWMIIGFGVFFQFPLVVITLSKLGIVKADTWAEYRRHVVVAIVVVAAFLTPGPDMFSQMILAVPSYLLFEVSLLIARRTRPS